MADVVCLLNVENDRATFTWSEGPASFAPYQVEGGLFNDFVECAAEARERLSDLVKDYLLDESNLPNSAFALAEAGHELYLQMFDPGAAQGRSAQEVRHWLESLRTSKIVDSLEIVVDTPWGMPWNVVYDEAPDRQSFLANDPQETEHWRPFWAIRYNLTGGRRVSPLRRIPLLNDPHVLMVIDPEIREGLPVDQQRHLRNFIETHQFQTASSKDELIAALQVKRPQLLYWLSHATPSALVLGNEEISPRQLRRLLRRENSDNPYEFGGIAFLNACQTAEAGQGGSFFDAFHAVGFSGMVGTEHQTVDTFANPLGLDFLNEFLIEGKPLGKVMRRLRARVPLGLLYGTYCPPDLCVEKLSEDSHIAIVQSPVQQGGALGEADSPNCPATLPDEPYRSLDFFGYKDRLLFAGRDDDVERFAALLDEDDTQVIVLHGESGVGKSSFLRAGVIPYLEDECVGYRFARSKLASSADEGAVLFVRATNDLAGSLAQSFTQLCTRNFTYPTPTGEEIEVDLPGILREVTGTTQPGELREAMLNDPGIVAALMNALAEQLPFELVLVIDQAEELFTLGEPDEADNRALALAMLGRLANSSGRFKIIVSLRTEYYGRLVDGLRRRAVESTRVREYLLTDFGEEGLIEAITRPTRRHSVVGGEVPFKKYGFSFEHGVADQIAKQVSRFSSQRRDSVLPLLQVICGQLYASVRDRDDKMIRLADLTAAGGVEGGLRSHVETMIAELFSSASGDGRPFKRVMTQLFLRQPDGGLTTALLREDEVASNWRGKTAFPEVLELAVQRRLLRVNTLRIGGDDERRYISLGHDSLAKVAAAWDEEFARGQRMQKLIASLAAAACLVVVVSGLAIFGWVNWTFAESNLELANERQEQALKNLDLARKNEREAAESIERIVEQISQNKSGVDALSRQLYVESLTQLDSLAENWSQAGGEADAETQAKLAIAYYWAGRVRNLIGESRSALSDLEKAEKLQTQLELDSNVKRDRELSDILMEIGNANFRIAEVPRDGEDVLQSYRSATVAFENAKKRRERLGDGGLERRLFANAMMNLAVCQMKTAIKDPNADTAALLASARKGMLEAQKIRNEVDEAGEESSPDIMFELAQGYQNLGELERADKNHDAALSSLTKAKAAFEFVLSEYPYHSESSASKGYCDLWIGYNLVWPSAGKSTKEDVESGLAHFQNAAKRGRELKHPVLGPYAESLVQAAQSALNAMPKDMGQESDPGKEDSGDGP